MVNGKKRPFLGSGDATYNPIDEGYGSLPGFKEWTQKRVQTDTGSKVVNNFRPPGHDYREAELQAISQQEAGSSFLPGFEHLITGKMPSAFNRRGGLPMWVSEQEELPGFRTQGRALGQHELDLLAIRGELKEHDDFGGQYKVPVPNDYIPRDPLGVAKILPSLFFASYEEAARQIRYQGEKQGRFMSSMWGGDSEQRYNEAIQKHELATGKKLDYKERQEFHDEFFEAPKFLRGGVELAMEILFPAAAVEKLAEKGIVKVAVPLSKPIWKLSKEAAQKTGFADGVGRVADYVLPDKIFAKSEDDFADYSELQLFESRGIQESNIEYYEEIINVIEEGQKPGFGSRMMIADTVERLGLDELARNEYGFDSFDEMFDSPVEIADVVKRATNGMNGARQILDTLTQVSLGRDEIGIVQIQNAVTGQRFTADLFRGVGRATPEEIYNDSTLTHSGAIFGSSFNGSTVIYSTPNKKASEFYGPATQIIRADLQNPLVIDSDNAWTTLTKQAGLLSYMPGSLDETLQLQKFITDAGYDGVVVRVPLDEMSGKKLQHAFGEDQVIDFTEKTVKQVREIPEDIRLPGQADTEASFRIKTPDGEDAYRGKPIEGMDFPAGPIPLRDSDIIEIAQALVRKTTPTRLTTTDVPILKPGDLGRKDIEEPWISEANDEIMSQLDPRFYGEGSETEKMLSFIDRVYGEDAAVDLRAVIDAMETEDTGFGIGMSALSQIRGKTVRAAGDAEGVEKFQNIINRSAEAGDKQALDDFDEPIEIMDEFLDEDGELLDKALVDKAVSFINRNFSKDFDKKPSNKVIDDFIQRLEDGDPELNEFVLDDNINNLRGALDAYRAFNYKDEVSGGMSPSDASSELRSLWDEVIEIGELIAPNSNFIKVHDVVARAGTVADEVAEVAAEPAARSADDVYDAGFKAVEEGRATTPHPLFFSRTGEIHDNDLHRHAHPREPRLETIDEAISRITKTKWGDAPIDMMVREADEFRKWSEDIRGLHGEEVQDNAIDRFSNSATRLDENYNFDGDLLYTENLDRDVNAIADELMRISNESADAAKRTETTNQEKIDQLLENEEAIMKAGMEAADEPVARQAGETNDEIKSEIQQEYENIRTKMDDKLFAKGALDFPQSPKGFEKAAAEHPVNKVPATEPTRTVVNPRTGAPELPPRPPSHKLTGQDISPEEFDNRIFADPPIGKTVSQRIRDSWRLWGELFNDQFIGIRKMQRQLEKQIKKDVKAGLTPVFTIVKGGKYDLTTLLTRLPGASSAAMTRYKRITNELKIACPNTRMKDIERILVIGRQHELLQMRDPKTGKLRFPDRKLPGKDGKPITESMLYNIETNMRNELGADLYREAEVGVGIILKAYREERERLFSSGLISKEVFDEFNDLHKWYNPIKYLDSSIEEAGGNIAGAAKQLNVYDNGIRSLDEEGLVAGLENPFDVLGEQLLKNEALIMENDTAKAIMKIAEALPEMNAVIKKVPAFKKANPKNTISFYENGKRVTYEVPAWLKRESDYVGQSGHGSIVEKIIATVNGISRATFTSISPAFIPINMLNDMLTAFMTRGITPWETGSRLLFSMKDSSRTIAEAHRLAGGYQARFYGKTGKGLPGKVGLDDKGIPMGQEDISKKIQEGFKETFTSFFGLTKLGEAAEQAPRQALFKRELDKALGKGWEKTYSPEEIAELPVARKAAADSIELTLNFARGGVAIKQLNNYVIFANAAFEGMKLPFRTIRDNPKSWIRIGAVASGQAGLTAYNLSAYPEYMDIPKEERWGSIIIMLPSKETDPATGRPLPRYLSIVPRTREWSLFLGSINYALEYAHTDYPEDLGTLGWNMLSSATPLTEIPAPVLMKEAFQQMGNYDYFRSRAIVPSEVKNKPASEQSMPWTNRTFREIGESINRSPIKIQHAFNSTFGGTGRAAVSITDEIIEMIDPTRVSPKISELMLEFDALDNPQDRSKFIHDLDNQTREDFYYELDKPDIKEGLSGVPVVGGVVGRILPGRYGDLRDRVEKGVGKQTGIDPEQTREVHNSLRITGDKHLNNQHNIDNQLLKGQIKPQDWIKKRAESGSEYKGALGTFEKEYPDAAHFADPEKRQKYYTEVARLEGLTDTSILQGRVLAAMWYSIELDDRQHRMAAAENDRDNTFIPNPKDWDIFWNKRKDFLDSLSEQEKGIWESELKSNMTPLEREYWDDQNEYINPFYSMSTDIIKFLAGDIDKSRLELSDKSMEMVEGLKTSINEKGTFDISLEDYFSYKDTADAVGASRTNIDYVKYKYIDQKILGLIREFERFNNYELDKALFKWGIVGGAKNGEWMKELERKREDSNGQIDHSLSVDLEMMNKLNSAYSQNQQQVPVGAR